MAKETRATELRALPDEELARRATELRENLFNMRLGLRTGELHETNKIGRARRDLARVLTVQRERAAKKAAEPQAKQGATP